MSPTPDGFNILHQALETMQKKEPNYTLLDCPIMCRLFATLICLSDSDEPPYPAFQPFGKMQTQGRHELTELMMLVLHDFPQFFNL